MENSDFVVMTTAEAKPGEEKIAQQALRDVADAARKQSGCIEYRVFRSAENPAVTVNVEQWISKDERDAFLAGADVEKFVSAVSGAFVESPQPETYEILDEA
ncbi:antibiotic biosynthesis monooxygenase [Aliifodinibius salicampi]|uniref:Antibiotic biosynthesis monooxygenase n=1 Tax=Fodinibius salicampi TaxID=1920655 RepID=A0ABT3Q1L0_9BACT|nr:antibiotic biosynthesis monooxygenase family protein [Fodinibius salicampi]MCW9713913.1 antibiotic biosynthesis monooxygenase [Fodinibius salicampi]